MPIGIKRSSESLSRSGTSFPSGNRVRVTLPALSLPLKTAWNNVRTNAQVKGRWHDNRHTLITDLAESGAGDQTIMDIAGHVSKQMLKHYSHIRMEAKRRALESIVTVRPAATEFGLELGQAEGYPQESPHGLKNVGKRTDRRRGDGKNWKRARSKQSRSALLRIAHNYAGF